MTLVMLGNGRRISNSVRSVIGLLVGWRHAVLQMPNLAKGPSLVVDLRTTVIKYLNSDFPYFQERVCLIGERYMEYPTRPLSFLYRT